MTFKLEIYPDGQSICGLALALAFVFKSKLMKSLVFVSFKAASTVPLVSHGDALRYHKPTNAPAPASWIVVERMD